MAHGIEEVGAVQAVAGESVDRDEIQFRQRKNRRRAKAKLAKLARRKNRR